MLFCNLQMHLKIKDFISQLNATHVFWVSVFLGAIPEYTDVFITSQHQFKNSVIIENGLLHWHPFMAHPFPVPHYCGISNLPSVCFPSQNKLYLSVYNLSHPSLMCKHCPFSNSLCILTSNIESWIIIRSVFLLILIIGLYHEWNQGSLEWRN